MSKHERTAFPVKEVGPLNKACVGIVYNHGAMTYATKNCNSMFKLYIPQHDSYHGDYNDWSAIIGSYLLIQQKKTLNYLYLVFQIFPKRNILRILATTSRI